MRHVVESELADQDDWPYLHDSKISLDEWDHDDATGVAYPIDPETGERLRSEYIDTGKRFLIDESRDSDGVKRRSIVMTAPSSLGWMYRICSEGGKEAETHGLVWKKLDDETDWKLMVRDLNKGIGKQAVIIHVT